jgi:hypothetical protein
MADQFSALELLLEDAPLDDPLKRKAMGAQLRKQNAMGVIGQLMGVQPTQMAGQNLQQGAQDSLKLAMSQRQAAKEAAAQQARQAVMDQRDARDFAQRAEGIEATRINQAATRAGSGPIVETKGGGVVRVGPDNVATPVTDASGGQVMKDPPKPTENQTTLATYGKRFEQNLPQLEALLDSGFMPSQPEYVISTYGLENPVAKQLAGTQVSDNAKSYYGAAAQLINAIMRRESGAAISAGEWANANDRWLPKPGDPPELVKQKRANLRGELEALKSGAGSAWIDTPPVAAPASKGVEWVRGPDGRPMRKQ